MTIAREYKMTLEQVRDLPIYDFRLMAADLERHPSEVRIHTVGYASLMAQNYNINRDSKRDISGKEPDTFMPWFKQTMPDYLMTEEEIEKQYEQENRANAALFNEAMQAQLEAQQKA